MIIGIWIATLFVIIVIVGEIKYRLTDRKGMTTIKQALNRAWMESVDIDIDKLSIEQVPFDSVSMQKLAMRGSWRVAQNQVMGQEHFEMLCKEEYAKKL